MTRGSSAPGRGGDGQAPLSDTQPDRQCTAALAEQWFPVGELSQLIARDRRARDPAYAAHRWWARRPPGLLRALLLALHLPATTTPAEFWATFGADDTPLDGLTVLDPFAGGGSTLVEAARLGATVRGGDIDPMAVRIVRRALAPAPADDVRAAGADLLATLHRELAGLYPGGCGETPLHYFSLAQVSCPQCLTRGLLYRDLVLARDRAKPGSVVRDQPLTVFCPDCFRLHHLATADRVRLRCCGRYHPVAEGTFTSATYHCPTCGTRSSHRVLRTGKAPRRLIAVETTVAGQRRSLREPEGRDLGAVERASSLWAQCRAVYPHPESTFRADRRDDRPSSYGIERYEQLFTDRQLLVLGRAFQWVRTQSFRSDVREALELAVSNALATNNRLCGYAVDYGRLSALFSVRGYSLPALAVELNPLHPDSGRGTLAACIERVARSAAVTARRYTWPVGGERPVSQEFTFRAAVDPAIDYQDAAAVPARSERNTADLAVFDPPYFDFIVYDELSEFHRAWLDAVELAGEPLLPDGDDAAERFGLRLGECLRNVLARLKSGRPLAFTYHSADPAAWRAVGIALDEAKLRVTAAWPVRSDGHMGHHSHPGNCEWDVVLICRPISSTTPARFAATIGTWTAMAPPFPVSDADKANFHSALAVAAVRFGTVNGEST